MKKILLSLIGLLVFSTQVFASGSTSDPIFQDKGNKINYISVAPSTTTVAISTSFPSGVLSFRERLIINNSTCSRLAIYSDGKSFTTFKSSFGVVLTSATGGIGVMVEGTNGRNWIVINGDVPIWGAWQDTIVGDSTTTFKSRVGAGGYEQYNK